MTIDEVYQRFEIMPNLALHMFRVTAVAEVIGQHLLSARLPESAQTFTQQDLEDVVTACLLHDLGNMAKFKLEYFPEFVQPQGLTYWQDVQQRFWQRYGKNAHQATLQMLNELGVSDRVKELVDAVSFNKAKQNQSSPDFARKLCAYADMRVGPHGVVSLDDRFVDGNKRYAPDGKVGPFTYAMSACLRNIERQLFAEIVLQPEEITDQKIAPLILGYASLKLG